MATTTNYSWTTPDDTDLVKDGAAAIRSLGSAIDSTVFTNAGAAIAKTIIDAKGDLISATAADTPARLASSGVNGEVLTIDTSTSTGLKWAAPGASAPNLTATGQSVWLRNAYQVGEFSGNIVFDEGRTFYVPVYLPSCTLDRIAIRTRGTASSGNTTRLGIYNNGSDNRPSTVLLDAGTVNPASTNTNYEITINQTITSGFYWLAVNRQVTASSGSAFVCYDGATGNDYLPFLGTQSINASNIGGWYENGVTGAFATAGSLTLISNAATLCPFIWVRIS